MGGEAAQAPQDEGDVGAEDAPQGVHLVHHHVLQPMEEVGPGGVVGEDAHVEHVGVGEHHVGALPDAGSFVVGGVTVVGGDRHLGDAQLAEAAGLVLGQRLGGVEQQGGGAGSGQDPLGDRDLETERLPGGGTRRQHRVATLPDAADGLGLVSVEPLHPPFLQPGGKERMQRRVERGVDGGAPRHLLQVHQLPLQALRPRPGNRVELHDRSG